MTASASLVQGLRHPLAFLTGLTPVLGRLLMLVCAALTSGLLMLLFGGSLTTLEERLGALGWTLASDEAVEQRITLVTIDEPSLAQIGWPWSRQQMAELVTAIDQAGAQLQLHDIVYTDTREGDDVLAAAMQAARGVVLAQQPVIQSEQSVQSGVMTHALTGVACDTAAGPTQGLAPVSVQSFLAPHNGFAAIPKGHIAPIVDSDGAIRKLPATVCVDGAAYPALAISALLRATGSQSWAAAVEPGTGPLGPAFTLKLNAYPGLAMPLDSDGNLRISYRSAPASYQAVSAVDVLNGNYDPELFDNTWVLVGATAFGLGDIVPTPYSGATPGIELQARILASILDTAIPYTPQGSGWLLALLSLVFSGVLVWLAAHRERLAAYGLPVAAVVLPVMAMALHIQLLASIDVWLGWVYPALYSLLAASLLLLLEQSRVRQERSRVFGNLNSYLPSDIAREIAYSLPSSSINAKRRDVTLLSADLRNFAAFGEARPPEESAAVLHFFFSRAADIIEQHGGRIHEFKGDGLLAVWDGNDAAAAEHALQAAREMQAAVHSDLLPLHPPAGLEPLALGIGIEQGPALIGSIGPAHRRSHTLLGDTVTITLRIQEMTAELAQPILVGECAARQLNHLSLESQGSYLLNGLRIPHTLFAPQVQELPRRRTRANQPDLKVVSGGRQ